MLRTFAVALTLGLCGAPSAAWAQMEVEVVPPVLAGQPPPPKREVRPACPAREQVYVKGHWVWREGQYQWLMGQWTVPPAASCKWSPSRYVKKQRRWYFYEGYWRDTNVPAKVIAENPETETVTVDRAPPAELTEVLPKAPFPNAQWAKGHWYWSGATWQWAGGHFEQTHPDFVWENARWTSHSPTTWGFTPGRWKHVKG